MKTPCLGGCGRTGKGPSVGRYICAPCTSRIMKADRAKKFAEVAERKRVGPISVPHCRVLDDKAMAEAYLRLEARARMADDAARAQVRTMLLEMSVMGGMSREVGAALDALDKETSE